MQAREPPPRQPDRESDDAERDDRGRCRLCTVAAFAPPRFHQRPRALELDRHGPDNVRPKERVEHARSPCEQLAGVQRVAFLGHALAQLLDPYREHARLFQGAVKLAEAGRKLLAFTGDFLRFGRCILCRRGAQLLQPFLDFARMGFKLVELAAQSIGRRVELFPQVEERFLRHVLPADRFFDLVQGRLDRLDGGSFGGLCPRSFMKRAGKKQHRRQAQKSKLPPDSQPPAPDHHASLSLGKNAVSRVTDESQAVRGTAVIAPQAGACRYVPTQSDAPGEPGSFAKRCGRAAGGTGIAQRPASGRRVLRHDGEIMPLVRVGGCAAHAPAGIHRRNPAAPALIPSRPPSNTSAVGIDHPLSLPGLTRLFHHLQ